jgi:4-methyl-5(b-hydroxyethyl)-thiazole monophosphate biosynthesis
MKKALIILAGGFEEIEAIVPIDLLKRAGINVTIVGLGEKEVVGSHGVKIVADEIFDKKNDDFDAIILPGGPGVSNLINDDGVLEIVKKFYETQKLCCAICAAPKVFDKLGMLKDRHYVCFPSVEPEIKNGIYHSNNVVVDKNVLTSKAAGTAFDFSYSIIKHLLNEETAQTVIDNICFSY